MTMLTVIATGAAVIGTVLLVTSGSPVLMSLGLGFLMARVLAKE